MPKSIPPSPVIIDVEEKRQYSWCRHCHPEDSPWCTKGCQSTIVYKPELSESVIICNCGQTKTPPFCDGSHRELLLDYVRSLSNNNIE